MNVNIIIKNAKTIAEYKEMKEKMTNIKKNSKIGKMENLLKPG